MTSVFKNFSSAYYEYDCPICYEKMKNTDCVAHEGEGSKHPLHRKCAKTWALVSKRCPICTMDVDVDSLFTWKEKSVFVVKQVGRDVKEKAVAAMKCVGAELQSMTKDAIVCLAIGSVGSTWAFNSFGIYAITDYRGEYEHPDNVLFKTIESIVLVGVASGFIKRRVAAFLNHED